MNEESISESAVVAAPAEEQRMWRDARIRKDDGPYTESESVALLQELADYRRRHRNEHGKPMPWKTVAQRVDIPESTMAELRSNRYRGDRQKYLRRIDVFLADERLRQGRFDDRAFAEIGLSSRIFAVMNAAIRHNSMACVIGESGVGKTMHGRAFAADREGAVFIRVDGTHGDGHGIISLIYQNLPLLGHRTCRQRMSAIVNYLRKTRTIVFVFDEAQQLDQSGLETIRDIHDDSDPEGRRNVPIIFLADRTFYRLVLSAQEGEPSPIKPQFTSRLFPVYSIGSEGDGGLSSAVFTRDDIIRIVRNDRLPVVTEEGIEQLAQLATLPGQGSLRFAMRAFALACDMADGNLVTPTILQKAVDVMIGRAGRRMLSRIFSSLSKSADRPATTGNVGNDSSNGNAGVLRITPQTKEGT